MQKSLNLLIFICGISLVVGVQFTGRADLDFSSGSLSSLERSLYYVFDQTQPATVAQFMIDRDRRSGVDLDAVHAVFRPDENALYVGVQCAGICGDVDGDGNPSAVDPTASVGLLGTDNPNMCNSEQISLMFWNNVPKDYAVDPFDSSWFFPSFVVGIDYPKCLVVSGNSNWFAYRWPLAATCGWNVAKNNPFQPCVIQNSLYVSNPGVGVYPSTPLHTIVRIFFTLINLDSGKQILISCHLINQKCTIFSPTLQNHTLNSF